MPSIGANPVSSIYPDVGIDRRDRQLPARLATRPDERRRRIRHLYPGLAVLQSLAQARDRWGRDAAGAIWDAAIVKLVLGGSANADDLADLSCLIGDREVREWSETRTGSATPASTSSSTRRRPILEPADLRRLPLGHGLLLRSDAPIMLRLTLETARRDAAELAAGRAHFEQPDRGDA